MRAFLLLICGLLCSFAGGATASDELVGELQGVSPPECGPCLDCGGCRCDWTECDRLFGMLPSDHCFDHFISPLSNPFFFEDPRSLTEARGLFIENGLPNQIDGGNAQVWAGQLRGRISDRPSIIAPRLGYLQVNQRAGDAPNGFMSAPVGLKYNLYRNVERQALLSVGMTYFIPGSESAISGFGDGDFHFFLTAGKQIFDWGHWLSATGFRIPGDSNWGTQLWYWSNQWDYEFADGWYAVGGVNWFHWMRSSGVGFTGDIAGLDLINLPAAGVAGNSVVTGVAGVKWKPSSHMELGTGFEFPLTDRTDILRNRLYVDAIWRY